MTLGHYGNYISHPTPGKEGGASGYVDSYVLDDNNEPIKTELDDAALVLDDNDEPILGSANEPILDSNNERVLDSNNEFILDGNFSTQTIFSSDNLLSDGTV